MISTKSKSNRSTAKKSRAIVCEKLARELKKKDPVGYRTAVEFYFFAIHGRLPTKRELDKEIREDGL